MWIGIFYLLIACLCWSGVFVIPRFISGFTALEISLGRFLCFGALSATVLLIKRRELLQRLWWPIWKKAFGLGFISTIGCYTATVWCIQYAGSKIATLLFGVVPIIVAVCGNYRKKEYPFSVLMIPCFLMGVGIFLSNLDAFSLEGESIPLYLMGFCAGIIGMGAWIWYVISCFEFMQKTPQVNSSDWVLMIGSGAFCFALLLGGSIVSLEGWHKYAALEIGPFMLGSLVLGGVSSWLALYCWTQGNVRLPISLVGQLAIFELIFGMIALFIVEYRMPSIFEGLGIGAMIVGVLQGLRSIDKKKKAIS